MPAGSSPSLKVRARRPFDPPTFSMCARGLQRALVIMMLSSLGQSIHVGQAHASAPASAARSGQTALLAELLHAQARVLGARTLTAMGTLQSHRGRTLDHAKLHQILRASRKISDQLNRRQIAIRRTQKARDLHAQRRALEFIGLRLEQLQKQLDDCAADVLPEAEVTIGH